MKASIWTLIVWIALVVIGGSTNTSTPSDETQKPVPPPPNGQPPKRKEKPAIVPLVRLIHSSHGQGVYMIEPLPRNTSGVPNATAFPCGGTGKGRTHLLSSPGSYTMMQWRGNKASDNGSCRVRISTGTRRLRGYYRIR